MFFIANFLRGVFGLQKPSTFGGRRDAKKFVDGLVQTFPVVVFSKAYCPYCKKAKNALAKFRLRRDTMHVVEMAGYLEKSPDCDIIQDYLLELTGHRTVPRVFIGGRCVGGGDEAAAMAENGDLEKLLCAAGAIA